MSSRSMSKKRIEFFRIDEMQSFRQLLIEQLVKLVHSLLQIERWKRSIPSPAYMAGIHAPILENKMDEDALTVEIFKQQILQGLDATDCLYGSSRVRGDYIMVSRRSVNMNRVNSIRFWFVKVLPLLKSEFLQTLHRLHLHHIHQLLI